jgi:hypothetical protein
LLFSRRGAYLFDNPRPKKSISLFSGRHGALSRPNIPEKISIFSSPGPVKERVPPGGENNLFVHNNMSLLNILISIDDTDNLESPGSGTAAENLAGALRKRGLAQCADITRHQLFVHENIPYTSHNSAMCFSAFSHADTLDEIILFGQDFLRSESAVGSDPGLCVAVNDSRLNKKALITFGQSAKKTIVSKQAAHDLARHLGVHLSEHGGTGGGIIGALAAIGLRLHGSDGRFRGWHHLGNAGEVTTPTALCSHPFIDAVVTDTGEQLAGDTPIIFAENTVKTVLLNSIQAVPVARISGDKHEPRWTTLSKKAMKLF